MLTILLAIYFMDHLSDMLNLSTIVMKAPITPRNERVVAM